VSGAAERAPRAIVDAYSAHIIVVEITIASTTFNVGRIRSLFFMKQEGSEVNLY
jgi:hypothetical protein